LLANDISSDIIDGTIERKTNDISTARFTVQGRRLGKKNETDPTTSLLLSQIIRPMDRIVVYLKKTKPILVFSGYLDLVPLVQFVPEPVTIGVLVALDAIVPTLIFGSPVPERHQYCISYPTVFPAVGEVSIAVTI
jgi:hypothetical protein